MPGGELPAYQPVLLVRSGGMGRVSPMLRRRPLLAFLVTGMAVALTGCSSAAPAPKVTPEASLSEARKTLVSAKFVHFVLETKDLPAGNNGVAQAVGTGEISTTEPKFQGTIQGSVNGVNANVEIVGVGEKAWWKLFTPDFTPADLASLDAPNPASFFHADNGVPKLLDATTNLAVGADTRVGPDIVHTITGELPGAEIKNLFHLGDGTGAFTVTYSVTDAGELRRAVVVGPFWEGATGTYTATLTDYGKAATIVAPE